MRLHRYAFDTHTIRLLLAASTVAGFAMLVSSGHAAWADPCTPPTNGPAGPDASAFAYQCTGAYAGEWTSAYYVYDPATAAESPLYTITYSYDCTTDTWTQNDWEYDATTDAYVEDWVPATATPTQPTNCPTTATSTNATGASTDNTVGSSSQSGNATVADNSTAGNATTGNTSTEVTDTNLVDSTGNALGNGVTTFTTNVGNVNGDLVLDPSTIPTTTDSSAASQPAALSSTTTDASVSNTITATSVSGNATVSGNGDAGDATTGSADTVVNLINIINSAVASGQSFIGTINIDGNLNGNILIPQSVVDQLLASNAISGQNTTGISNETIVNDINAAAQSGDATVANNSGTYGDAVTGSANTNITILNLTGSSVIGKNVLLVFVNVMGTWTGLILNAPAGATSAEFGGGVTSEAPSTGASVVEAGANLSITNNVDALARSGNAIVEYNQNAGNATSGNAETGVNILNIENSDLSLANWFGILFINVFGTWNGNFGILPTPTQTPPSATTPSNVQGNASTDPTQRTQPLSAPEATTAQFATFIPDTDSNPSIPSASNNTAVLGDATVAPVSNLRSTLPTHDKVSRSNYLLPLAGLCFAALILAFSERDRFLHRHSD